MKPDIKRSTHTNVMKRNAIRDRTKLWFTREIPYTFDDTGTSLVIRQTFVG